MDAVSSRPGLAPSLPPIGVRIGPPKPPHLVWIGKRRPGWPPLTAVFFIGAFAGIIAGEVLAVLLLRLVP